MERTEANMQSFLLKLFFDIIGTFKKNSKQANFAYYPLQSVTCHESCHLVLRLDLEWIKDCIQPTRPQDIEVETGEERQWRNVFPNFIPSLRAVCTHGRKLPHACCVVIMKYKSIKLRKGPCRKRSSVIIFLFCTVQHL